MSDAPGVTPGTANTEIVRGSILRRLRLLVLEVPAQLSGKVLWAADGLHFLANWFADLECWLSGHGTWDSLRAMRRRPPSTGRG